MHSVHVDAIIRPIPTHVFDTRDVDVSVFLSVCVAVLVTTISPAKTAELIEIEFGGGTCVGQRNRVLDGVHMGEYD